MFVVVFTLFALVTRIGVVEKFWGFRVRTC